MFRKLLHRWESLAPRHQIMVATPVAFVVLFLIHASPLFPLLDWKRALTYALMECVPVALVLTFATQTELARRAHMAQHDAARHDEAGALPDDDSTR